MKKRNQQLEKIRNIGIIAHVDAGKTTVSERILYYTGKIHSKGEVHNGEAKMDGDIREIAHGITISSAATTVSWCDHQINLIDTPGHVDFGIEVKRSLRVLDGAVVVFDAVAGVEPQTETNWRLADEFGVARIAFVNKMDRPGADFARVVEMMQERLGITALPIQLPIVNEETNTFLGLIDLVKMHLVRWIDEDGKQIEFVPIPEDWVSRAESARVVLVETAAEMDDDILSALLESGTEPTDEEVLACLRAGSLTGAFVPVLCGTALKNRGLQPLLDAVVGLLPAPFDTRLPEGVEFPDGFVAYAFKTIHKGGFGNQTWLRIYSGKLQSGMRVRNTTRDSWERISRLVRMNSNDEEEISVAEAGDIVAVIGMKSTHTGDTLCGVDHRELVLETIGIPDPVARVVIEAGNREDRDKLGMGLNRLTVEDPTLQIFIDPGTGQSILAGMGELHLEMAKEKLEGDLDIEISFGKPQVAYRETIREPKEVTYRHSKQDGGKGQFAEVVIRFEPLERGLGFEFESRITGGAIKKEFIPGVEKGIRKAMETGCVDGYPVVDVRAVLIDGKIHEQDSSILAFEIAGFHAFRDAMPKASPVLLEPVMQVQVVTPPDYLGEVIGDLNRRRGLIQSQNSRGSSASEIVAEVPLARLFGYIGDLRSLTSGRANFTMEFDHYAKKVA